MSSHGSTLSEVISPRSRFYQGPFGRMFRNLPSWEPECKHEKEQIDSIENLVNNAFNDDNDNPDGDNSNIPAGYTYFGQFVDHDITFDPTSSLQRQNDPNKLLNFRTPRFDLDCVYGRGPADQPYLYRKGKDFKGEFLIGKNSKGEPDLPRNEEDQALIGDMRNDENIIVSQMQLAFLKFHNTQLKAVKDHFKDEDKQVEDSYIFAEAQRITRWHYQWVVIHDFLKRLCTVELVDQLLAGDHPGEPNLSFYDFKEQPFMPVEFSGAAYRLGHSMVRFRYHLNDKLTNKLGQPLNILGTMTELSNLNGGRVLPYDWTIQWDRFVEYEGSTPQLSRRLDTSISTPLKNLPLNETDPRFNSLLFRNVLRGWRLGLPSGQTVAKRMGIDNPLEGNDPLWIYILKEAGSTEGQGGRRLGSVGRRIVGEVFIGLLAGDPQSYYSVEPGWQPDAVREGGKYELSDFLAEAGMPMTSADIDELLGSDSFSI